MNITSESALNVTTFVFGDIVSPVLRHTSYKRATAKKPIPEKYEPPTNDKGQTAIDEIREFVVETYGWQPELIAKEAGIGSSATRRFWNGLSGSTAIAKWVAKTQGGKYIALQKQAHRDTVLARSTQNQRRSEFREVMPNPHNHHDTKASLSLELPAVHMQPERVGL